MCGIGESARNWMSIEVVAWGCTLFWQRYFVQHCLHCFFLVCTEGFILKLHVGLLP